MANSARSKADRFFKASQKTDKQFLKEKERIQQERLAHLEKLRAQRLAKEAADREDVAANDPAKGK